MRILLTLLWLAFCVVAGAEEPALPLGLGSDKTTSAQTERQEPSPTALPLGISGFWDNRVGTRTRDDPVEDSMSLAESRLQLRFDLFSEAMDLRLVTDFVQDGLAPDHSIDLLTGEGWFDLREANILLRLNPVLDAKIGRQVLTWGTGDLVFVNDLFPKDWRSFFLGRDLEYLKAPSDAIRLTLAANHTELDLVYSPRFNPDRFLDGSRVSFFDPISAQMIGEDDPIDTSIPGDWLSDDEIAARLRTMVKGYEVAAYGYDGFWKSPAGYAPSAGYFRFPRLRVFGLSAEGPVGPGLMNLEAGYYDSREGDDPAVRNSEIRFLAGYEMEIAQETTLGLQYYLEHMLDHDAYLQTLPAGTPAVDEDRHVLTVRVDWVLLNQDLRLNTFGYLSPSDEDGYLRASAKYRMDDNWSLEAGINHFFGSDRHTFFGQYQRNSNLYLSIRYGFVGTAH